MQKKPNTVSLVANGRGRSLDIRGDRFSVLSVATLYYFNRPLCLLVACAVSYYLHVPIGELFDLALSNYGK